MSDERRLPDKFRIIREDHIVEGGVVENPNGSITITYIPEDDRERAMRFVLSLNTDPPAYAAAWLYSKLCHPALGSDLRMKLAAVRRHGWRMSKTGMRNMAFFIEGLMASTLRSLLGDLPRHSEE